MRQSSTLLEGAPTKAGDPTDRSSSVGWKAGWKGRWRDNVFVERIWKSIKYEEVYLHAYASVSASQDEMFRSFKPYKR